MGFIVGLIKGIIKRLIKLGLLLAVIAAVILLVPNLPPYTKFTSIQLEPTQPQVGPLALNGAINNVEKLYKDKLLGPEAFQQYNGELYTSLATGEIVKISLGGHVTFVTKLGEPCTGPIQAEKCGRPLGFEIDEKTKQMYVADAYYGIWRVDLTSHKKQLLVSPRVAIKGRLPKIFNDLALGKNGDFYWTDSSSDFDLKDGAYSMLSDPSGRLFYYNAAKNQSTVLLNNLWFANGVVVSPDNQFVLVAETCRLRVMKYYIDGPNKGKSEVFSAGLPGVPDNLRVLPDGSGVLVCLYSAFDENRPLLIRSMSQAPLVRKFLARLQRLIEIPFEFINKQFPNPIFEEIVFNIGHFKSLSGLLPGISGILQVDWNGNIVASYYNTDGGIKGISDAIVYNDKLLTGAPDIHNFIAAVPVPPLLKKAFASTKPTPATKTAETVTKEVPKPKVESQPKPVETKPKVEEKKESVKETKPIAQEPPKPKPVETVKSTTPKPVEKKPVETTAVPTPKPTQAPKPAETKPTTTTPKPQTTTPKPEAKPTKPSEPKTTPPPRPSEPKTTPPPKSSEPTTTPPSKQAEPKTTTPKPEIKPKTEEPAVKPKQTPPETIKPVESKPQKPTEKPSKIPDQIPIKEEIPSDTVKPSKETLKVIKRGGPAEIPNPEL